MGERKGPSEGWNLKREVEKQDLITERGLYREGRGLRVERGEGLRAKATARQVGEQLGDRERRDREGGEGLRKDKERKREDKEREEDKEGERTTERDRERPGGKTRREEWTREEGKQGERCLNQGHQNARVCAKDDNQECVRGLLHEHGL